MAFEGLCEDGAIMAKEACDAAWRDRLRGMLMHGFKHT